MPLLFLNSENRNSIRLKSLEYADPYKSGKYYVVSINNPGSSDTCIRIQTPKLKVISGLTKAKGKWYIEVELPYNSELNDFLVNLDDYNKTTAYLNSETWFNKKLSPEDIEDSYKNNLSSGSKSNPVKFKLIISKKRNKPDVKVFNCYRKEVDLSEVIPGVTITPIISLPGLWFTKTRIGCDWYIEQVKLHTKLSQRKKLKSYSIVDSDSDDLDNIIEADVEDDEAVTEDVIEKPVTEDVVEKPVTEDVVEKPVTEDVVEKSVTEDVVEKSVTEDVVEATEEVMAEVVDVEEESVSEDLAVKVDESVKEEPTAEVEEPVVEPVKEEPTAEDTIIDVIIETDEDTVVESEEVEIGIKNTSTKTPKKKRKKRRNRRRRYYYSDSETGTESDLESDKEEQDKGRKKRRRRRHRRRRKYSSESSS